MSVEETAKKYVEAGAKKILAPKGKEETAKVEDITISSLSELKDKLQIQSVDTSTVEELKNPIKFTKEELDKLKADMLGADVNKLAKLKEIIKSKVEVSHKTNSDISDFKAAMATGGIASVGAYASKELSSKIEEAKGAEGLDKISKFGELFEWGKDLFKKITSYLAVKVPFLANLFGWKNEYPELADAKKKGEEVVVAAKDKAEEAKEKAEGLKDKATEAVKEGENDLIKRKEKLIQKFENRWGVDLKDPTRRTKFEECWSRYVQNTSKYTISKKEEYSKDSVHLFDFPVGYSIETFRFMIDLANNGVLPAEAIKFEAKEAGSKVFRFGIESSKTLIGLGAGGLDDFMGELSIEEMGETFDKLGDKERIFLASIINRKLNAMTYLTGLAASQLVNLAYVVPVTWHERTGAQSISMAWNSAFGKYDELAKGFETLLKRTGGTSTDAANKLRSHLIELHTQTRITDAFVSAKDNSRGFIDSLNSLKTQPNVNTKLVNDAILEIKDVTKPLSGYKNAISIKVSSNGTTRGIIPKGIGVVDKFFRGKFANPEIYVDELISKSVPYQKGLGEAVVNVGNNKVGEVLSKLKNFMKVSPVPGSANHAICAVQAKDLNEFHRTLKIAFDDTPNLIKGLFSHMAIIIVGASSLNMKGDKMKNFATGMTSLIPFVGPMFMMYEGTEFKNGEMPKTGDLVIGGTLVTVDVLSALKIWSTHGFDALEWGKFFARPVVMTGELVGGISKTAVGTYEMTSGAIKAWNAGNKAELIGLARRGVGWGVVLTSIIAASAYAYKNYSEMNPEELMTKLKNDGFIDKDGNLNEEKVKSSFAALSKDKQELLSIMIVEAGLNGPSNLANHISLPSGEKLKIKEFEIEKIGELVKIRLNSVATIEDQKQVQQIFDKLGIRCVFTYTYKALRDYAKLFKEKGQSEVQYIARMQDLGIKEDPKIIAKYYA